MGSSSLRKGVGIRTQATHEIAKPSCAVGDGNFGLGFDVEVVRKREAKTEPIQRLYTIVYD
jgi:hypothetical protein